MNLGIVVLEYARAIREEKIHWWDNLVIQYIQELCWLAVPKPDQLKQPRIITLQFADLNRNDNSFFGRAVYPAGVACPVWMYDISYTFYWLTIL